MENIIPAELQDFIAGRGLTAGAVIAAVWLIRDHLYEPPKKYRVWFCGVVGAAMAWIGSHYFAAEGTMTMPLMSTLLEGAFTGLAAAGLYKGVKDHKTEAAKPKKK